jgi:hypothetical protein
MVSCICRSVTVPWGTYCFRFVANAGDQVPPGAEARRIVVMRDLV